MAGKRKLNARQLRFLFARGVLRGKGSGKDRKVTYNKNASGGGGGRKVPSKAERDSTRAGRIRAGQDRFENWAGSAKGQAFQRRALRAGVRVEGVEDIKRGRDAYKGFKQERGSQVQGRRQQNAAARTEQAARLKASARAGRISQGRRQANSFFDKNKEVERALISRGPTEFKTVRKRELRIARGLAARDESKVAAARTRAAADKAAFVKKTGMLPDTLGRISRQLGRGLKAGNQTKSRLQYLRTLTDRDLKRLKLSR